MSVRIKIDGRRLAELRDARFLDRKDLAEAVGVSHHTISRIETGRTLYPRRSTIRAIALVLGVGPDDLVART
jgi:transcriptional regulator with XRE-family HTH domain